jgi:hypothetical protein
MFWLAVAAQLSAPAPVHAYTWFSPEDVPAYLIERGSGLWWVRARVTVAPDGRIQRCEVEGTSGIADLDKLTCRLILRRGKFRAAHLADGTAAFGVYRTSIRWAVAESSFDLSAFSNPDVEVSAQRLPQGAKSPGLVGLMFKVDQDGEISSCEAEPPQSFSHAENNPALVPVACVQLMKIYKATPAKNAAGQPVQSVQDALVRFVVGDHGKNR